MKKIEKLHTVNQAVENRGMSKAFWRQAIFLKKIEVVRIGRAVRLTESAMDKYLSSVADVSKPA